MTRAPPGEATLLELGTSYLEEIFPYLSLEIRGPLLQSMSRYLSGEITYDEAQATFFSLIGRSDPLQRLKDIITVPDEPIPCTETPDPEDASGNSRKKTRPWTSVEDARLIAGIYKFGLDNWTTISMFIGNGRTRAQCCQRWARGLNPRISKDIWNYEEDMRLFRLVSTYGDKSWTKIASMMGNRSDVQCRYHYHQIIKDMPNPYKDPRLRPTNPNMAFPSMGPMQMNYQQIRPIPIPRGMTRNSLPNINPPPYINEEYARTESLEPTPMRPTPSQPSLGLRPTDSTPPPIPVQRPIPKPTPANNGCEQRPKFMSLTPIDPPSLRRPRSNSENCASSLDGFLRKFL